MEFSRHRRRILLIQALFLWEYSQNRMANAQNDEFYLRYIWDHLSQGSYDENAEDFDKKRYMGVIQHLRAIQKKIRQYAPDWPIEKIASHDRSILYLGIYELIFTDTASAIIINEAVELAKEFGGDRSSKFINGVLSNINKDNLKDVL